MDMEVILEPVLPTLIGLTPFEAASVILPLFLQVATSAPSFEKARDIVIQVNNTNNLISLLEGRPINSEPTLKRILPASKASIEAMPVVKVLDEGIDCSICLLGFEIDEEANHMPCKHRFHLICIDRWLGINGSCPICRYKMSVDEQCEKNDDESDEDERGDASGNEMEEDRLLSTFHIVNSQDAIGMKISIPEVPTIAYRLSIGDDV